MESLGEAMLALGLVLRQGGFFPNVQERKVTGSLLWLACSLSPSPLFLERGSVAARTGSRERPCSTRL